MTKGRPEPKQRVRSRNIQARPVAGKHSLRPGPVRTCIGCRQQGFPVDLVRMVLGSDGRVAFDLAGGAMGRGAWVHAAESCLRKAAKSTGRSLRADGSEDVEALRVTLANAALRRSAGLLGAAYRARHLALGGGAGAAAFSEGKARLVVLATDARAAKKESWVEAAAAKGTVVAWATKAELGAIVGRDELAVAVVTDEGLARNLLRVMAMTIPVTSRLAKANCEGTAVTVSTRTTGSQGRQDSEDG